MRKAGLMSPAIILLRQHYNSMSTISIEYNSIVHQVHSVLNNFQTLAQVNNLHSWSSSIQGHLRHGFAAFIWIGIVFKCFHSILIARSIFIHIIFQLVKQQSIKANGINNEHHSVLIPLKDAALLTDTRKNKKRLLMTTDQQISNASVSSSFHGQLLTSLGNRVTWKPKRCDGLSMVREINMWSFHFALSFST